MDVPRRRHMRMLRMARAATREVVRVTPANIGPRDARVNANPRL
jgi:hypothetical protein